MIKESVQNTFFHNVKIGQVFVMYDILMIKTDVGTSVAIGHMDHIGFHLVYRDDLISQGLLPHNIHANVLVSIINFDVKQDYEDEFLLNNFNGVPTVKKTFDPVFVIDGQPYVVVDAEDYVLTLLNLYDILEIENVGDFGVLDAPNTLFIRNGELLNNWIYFAKD